LSGSYSDSAYSTSAFSTGAFDFGTAPPPVVTVGGHFAGRKKRKPHDYADERAAKARLREQIRAALEGPHAEQIEQALSAYISPQKTDTRYVPVTERVRWERIYDALGTVELLLLSHLQMAEDEEDDDLLLLNG
jgi:hypothetical protein